MSPVHSFHSMTWDKPMPMHPVPSHADIQTFDEDEARTIDSLNNTFDHETRQTTVDTRSGPSMSRRVASWKPVDRRPPPLA